MQPLVKDNGHEGRSPLLCGPSSYICGHGGMARSATDRSAESM